MSRLPTINITGTQIAVGRMPGMVIGGVVDATPGGPNDVWMWEDGIGLLWEAGILMRVE